MWSFFDVLFQQNLSWDVEDVVAERFDRPIGSAAILHDHHHQLGRAAL